MSSGRSGLPYAIAMTAVRGSASRIRRVSVRMSAHFVCHTREFRF
jgi:hypothetical protein